MLFGDLGPLLRPLSRRLAAVGWSCAAVGLVSGLAVAVGSGVRVPAAMVLVQTVGIIATAAAGLLLMAAVLTQPAVHNGARAQADGGLSPHNLADGNLADGEQAGGDQAEGDPTVRARADWADAEWRATTASAQVRSFLLASVAMLVAVVGFAVAGWMLPNGPSPQSLAFSQIFLLGAACCGLTFVLLHKVVPAVRHRVDAGSPEA